MNVVLSGYGKMGKEIAIILQSKNIDFTATEDIKSIPKSIAEISVCIDFTTPEAFKGNYHFLADSFKAVVVGTTGWNEMSAEIIDYFKKSGTTFLYASNFSIGVNIFSVIMKLASAFTFELADYEPYMIEMHHKMKLDAPSGTAKSLASIIESAGYNQVDIKSIRSGMIPGIHEVGFESPIDRIVLKHEAFSRKGFAEGAVKAAEWSNNLNGVHDFSELMHVKFKEIIYKLIH